MDEKIIAMMAEAEAEAEDTQEVGQAEEGEGVVKPEDLVQQPLVKIGEEWVPFEERSLLDGAISLRMPKSFTVMSPQVAKLKYPSSRRPGLIFTDDSQSVNLAFNHTETPLEDEDVEDFTDAISEMLKRTQPAANWIKEDVIEVNGMPAGICSFILPVVDSDVYQLMFYVSVEEKALLLTFNCLKDQMKDWEQVAEGMMLSLKRIEEGGAQQ